MQIERVVEVKTILEQLGIDWSKWTAYDQYRRSELEQAPKAFNPLNHYPSANSEQSPFTNQPYRLLSASHVPPARKR